MANINVEASKFIIDTLFKGRAVIIGPNKPFILGVNDLINLIAILTAMPRESVEIDVDEN
jgi:predicted methyltransferase